MSKHTGEERESVGRASVKTIVNMAKENNNLMCAQNRQGSRFQLENGDGMEMTTSKGDMGQMLLHYVLNPVIARVR